MKPLPLFTVILSITAQLLNATDSIQESGEIKEISKNSGSKKIIMGSYESDISDDTQWTSDVLKQAQVAGLSDLVADRLKGVKNELNRSKRVFSGNPIDDPLFGLAWHLSNSGNNGGLRGEDINVIPVWD
ncbi:MAG: hypothetical protein MI748_17385, partial [Opitutales bacterium]|nr:hypothetical protein [Opitutales bacterium]